jgi:hypothetical protein
MESLQKNRQNNVSTSNLVVTPQSNNTHHWSIIAIDAEIYNME